MDRTTNQLERYSTHIDDTPADRLYAWSATAPACGSMACARSSTPITLPTRLRAGAMMRSGISSVMGAKAPPTTRWAAS